MAGLAPRRHLLATGLDRPGHLARHPPRKTLIRTNRYRSFFWPAVLILVGVFALLVNTGQLSADRVFELVNLWPVILIVIGLELIVRRSVHGPAGDLAAAVIVLLAVVGAAVYVTVTPVPATTGTLDASSEVGGVTDVDQSRGNADQQAGDPGGPVRRLEALVHDGEDLGEEAVARHREPYARLAILEDQKR